MPEQSQWASAVHRAVALAEALDSEPAVASFTIVVTDQEHDPVILKRVGRA